MKQLMTLSLLLLTLLAFSQNDFDCVDETKESAYFGFNNVSVVLKEIVNDPPPVLVHEVSKIPAKSKVQRFEGGESLNEDEFETKFTLEFINFCLITGTKYVILKAKIADEEGSLRTYQLLRDYGLDVLWIELDNEPYLDKKNPLQTREDWIDGFWLARWRAKFFHKRQAVKYAKNAKSLSNKFIEAFGTEVVDKFAYASPVPFYAKEKVWYATLIERLPEIKTVVLHVYTFEHAIGIEETFNRSFLNAMDIVKESGKDFIVTEFFSYNYENIDEQTTATLSNSANHINQYCFIKQTCLAYGAKYMGRHYFAGYNKVPFIKFYIDKESGSVINNHY